MKRIMIVDDSMYTRLVLRDLLLSHGYSVVAEASSGKQALEQYEIVKPDAVIIDTAMPDMDGIVTTRELKREHPDAVVILAAAQGERSSVVQGLSVGAVDFIAKPYAPRKVIQTLRKSLI